MILTAGRNQASVMPIYRRMCRFNVTVHLLILFAIHKYPIYSFTTLTAMQESEVIHSVYSLFEKTAGYVINRCLQTHVPFRG